MRRLSRLLRPNESRSFRDDIRLYKQLLPANALCFDVGANIGEKSEAMLCAGARVIAFEPNPRVLPELRARCDGSHRWTLIAAAVGKDVGLARFFARAAHGHSSLSEDWEGNILDSYYVPLITLDAVIACCGVPDYCKIDVEGWEFQVLAGLTNPIRLVSFEFHLNERAIPDTLRCLERLHQTGPSHANLTAAEAASFHLPEWMPLDRFIEWFPGDLKETLPGFPYGDIFVRRNSAG